MLKTIENPFLRRNTRMMYTGYPTPRTASSFMHAVYAWMAAALSVTAVVAYFVATTPHLVRALYSSPFLLLGLFVAQIALAVMLQSAINNVNFALALGLFFGYAGLVGLTLSGIFYIYTMASIGTAFATTALMFGGMSVYGYVTKADLTATASRAMMVLWGLMVALCVNLFFKNEMLDLVISAVGVIVFSLLTAYDTQKMKEIARELIADDETTQVISLRCAFMLYLDFINLFIYLLRFIGKPRDNR
jgi:uncharacterized protein